MDLEAQAQAIFEGKKTENEFAGWLAELTDRSAKTIWKDLKEPDELVQARLRAACRNDDSIYDRVLPFAGLIRTDSFDEPVVIHEGSLYVTTGLERRQTGTHYTPRSLTEPIVQYALEPLVYEGPAEGWPREEWKLHTPAELLALKICDMACGSGAFLVQACRYLSERLAEAWEEAESPGLNSPGLKTGSNVERTIKRPEDTDDSALQGACNVSTGVYAGADIAGADIAGAPTSPPTPLPQGEGRLRITPFGLPATGAADEMILPDDENERLVLARRLVVERCLYGVDKNPMAVEMAKISLWLVTMDRGRAFTFLDHALKCGDSLLGVDMQQLRTWSLDRAGEGLGFPEQEIEKAIDKALAARDKLREFTVNTIEDVDRKEHLLAEAESAMRRLHLGGDLLVGSFLSGPNTRVRAENEQNTRNRFYAYLHDVITHDRLVSETSEMLSGRRPFHWPLEFPEVFLSSHGFDALIGNPPFQGGQRITGALGTEYRDYLVEHLAGGRRGSADLCAYFFLRVGSLLHQGGCFGLLATNTIAQGDTREVGLDQLTNSNLKAELRTSLYRAVPSRKWPGTANLEVAHVWGRKGDWKSPCTLDEILTTGITPYLSKPGTVQGDPYPLIANANKSFQGSIVLGMGFVLTPDGAEALIQKDPRNKEVLFPYLNGEDLNSRPDQSPSRWVINFFDWPVERAMEYPDCFQIVEEKVKPERTRLNEDGEYALRKPLPHKWWIYAEKRPALYATIAGMERVLVRCLHTNTHALSFTQPCYVFSHALAVISAASSAFFALVQSSLHEYWAATHGSTLGAGYRYTPTDCFETFPFPTNSDNLDAIGERYHEFRRQIMLSRQEGLTKTYNRFHKPDEKAEDIAELRRLHIEMDQAVAAAYGWSDLDLGHGFHDTRQGLRYTLSEPARREILDRLLALNHQRHEEELKAGLHEKKGKKASATKGAKKKARGMNGQGSMWFEK